MSKYVQLGDVAKIYSGGTPSRTNPAYWNGDIPWVKTAQIQNGVITAKNVEEWITEEGVRNSSAKMVPKGTILMAMYGQGKTRGQVAILGIDATINQACAAIQLNNRASRDFVYQQLLFRYNSIRALSNSGSQENLSAGLIREIEFPFPSFPDQVAIADLLSTWDAASEKTERLVAAKERRFGVLRERYLQKTRQSKRAKLQTVTRESTARNGVRLGRDAIMAVTKKVGMRSMKEETIAAGIERYKVVRPRAFAYNPMRLNIGSIAMSPFDADVLVSPDYVVFECDESRLLPGYLNHLRFSRHWTNYFENAGNGSVRVRIYYDDLSAFTFDLPPVDVQKRIVDFLDAVGLEIDLLKKQAEACRRQKRGLMQKLLTGEWRVKVCTDQLGLTLTDTD